MNGSVWEQLAEIRKQTERLKEQRNTWQWFSLLSWVGFIVVTARDAGL